MATWSCPRCTFEESVQRPGCSMCGEERPDEVDPDRPLVYLKREFECPICCDDEEGIGVRVGQCQCEVCKYCVRRSIRDALDGLPKCPICQEYLTETDMRKLLSKEEWEERLDRVLKKAETNAPHAFHCLTPDCKGWTDAEGSKFFLCPVCRKVNCIPCGEQHDGQTCECHKNFLQTQRQQRIKDEEKTEEFLEELVKNGLAMRCPTCNLVVEKLDGCSFLRCGNPTCKMHLCWPTKGPRWGPKGEGDTSGGCRCGVGGRRCHPECNNCH